MGDTWNIVSCIAGILGLVVSAVGLYKSDQAFKAASKTEETVNREMKSYRLKTHTSETINYLDGLFQSVSHDGVFPEKAALWNLYSTVGDLLTSHEAELSEKALGSLRELKSLTFSMISFQTEKQEAFLACLSDTVNLLKKELTDHE